MSDKKNEKAKSFEHELVPEHILLNEEEANEILAKYKIHRYQLPHIKASDPAVRDIKAVPGDVVKILRKSQTAGTIVVYRYVVEG